MSLRKLGGVYYSRIFIPADLKALFPRTEYQKSLRTRSRKTASTLHCVRRAEAEEVFVGLRYRLIAPEKLADVLQQSLAFTQGRRPHQLAPEAKKTSELYLLYVAERERTGDWRPKTRQESQTSMNLFLELVGDPRVKDVQKGDLFRFRENLLRLPPSFKKNPNLRDLSMKEILSRKWEKTLSLARVNKIINGLMSFFTWCGKHGFCHGNPCKGLLFSKGRLVKAEKPRVPFTSDELVKTFSSPELKAQKHDHERPERFWGPWIALYSGLRLNEVCQLAVADIKEEGGVWHFDVNEQGAEKSLKTASSRRKVPVHPQLIKMGLLSYMAKCRAAGSERLFPGLKAGIDGFGHSLRNWFSKLLKGRGIGKCFHELRHTFAFFLRQAGVEDDVVAELLGHARNSMTARYTHGLLLQRKFEVISKGIQPRFRRGGHDICTGWNRGRYWLLLFNNSNGTGFTSFLSHGFLLETPVFLVGVTRQWKSISRASAGHPDPAKPTRP